MDFKKYCKKYPDFTLEEAEKMEEVYEKLFETEKEKKKGRDSSRRIFKMLVKWIICLLYPGLVGYLYMDAKITGNMPTLYEISVIFLFPTTFIFLFYYFILSSVFVSNKKNSEFLFKIMNELFKEYSVKKHFIEQEFYDLLYKNNFIYNSRPTPIDEPNYITQFLGKNYTFGLGDFLISSQQRHGPTDNFLLETITFTEPQSFLNQNIQISQDDLDSKKSYIGNMLWSFFFGCCFFFGLPLLLRKKDVYGHTSYEDYENFIAQYFYYLLAAVIIGVVFQIFRQFLSAKVHRKASKLRNVTLEQKYDVYVEDKKKMVNEEFLEIVDSFAQKSGLKREYSFLFSGNQVIIKLSSLPPKTFLQLLNPMLYREVMVLYILEIKNFIKFIEELQPFFTGEKSLLEKVEK